MMVVVMGIVVPGTTPKGMLGMDAALGVTINFIFAHIISYPRLTLSLLTRCLSFLLQSFLFAIAF